MIPRASIEFKQVHNPISKPVTKFGGQPVWLAKAEWPLSKETGQPMMFIGQIELDQRLFQGAQGKMAYIFITPDDEESLDCDTWDPEAGENAVIIQSLPNGANKEFPLKLALKDLVSGPTIVPEQGTGEFETVLNYSEDPAFVVEDKRFEWSDDEINEYTQAIEGNKIGGTPYFIQGDDVVPGNEWKLLLQLDSTEVPFHVNFGDAGMGYVFINQDGTQGKFLWQCM